MPSCVIKNCKNNSLAQKKHIGITFHKFPEEFNWKNKWIQVIRSNRNDGSWVPSKFSVVCSVHFIDDDLCITEGGLRRVVKDAIPKKMLDEEMKDGDCFVVSDSSSGSPSPISFKIIEEPITKIVEDEESIGKDQCSPMSDHENDLRIPNVKSKPRSPMTGLGIDSCNPLGNVENSDADIESSCDTSLESKLRKQLNRETEIVKNNRNKIKRLRQKLKRLKITHETLNKELNELKEKNAIEQEETMKVDQ